MPERKPSFGRHLVFREGVHSNEGVKVWPADRVRGVLDASKRLSPSQIPYTLLHPDDSLPIYGFASRESLRLETLPGGEVALSLEPLSFADAAIPALKRGGLDKVSIGLGADNQIVHIGLVPKPAVAGLGTVFSEGQMGSASAVVEFSSGDLNDPVRVAFGSVMRSAMQWRLSDIADVFRRWRESLIEASSVEAADKVIPSYVVESIAAPLPEDEPTQDQGNGDNNNFSDETMTKEEIEVLRAKAARVDELMTQMADREAADRDREVIAFCDSIMDRLGADREVFEFILRDLQGCKPRVFAAADGTTSERSSYDALKEVLVRAKPVVTFGEVAVRGKAGSAGASEKSLEELAAEEVEERLNAGRKR